MVTYEVYMCPRTLVPSHDKTPSHFMTILRTHRLEPWSTWAFTDGLQGFDLDYDEPDKNLTRIEVIYPLRTSCGLNPCKGYEVSYFRLRNNLYQREYMYFLWHSTNQSIRSVITSVIISVILHLKFFVFSKQHTLILLHNFSNF